MFNANVSSSNILDKMTPAEFKQLTGINWTKILYIINNYKTILSNQIQAASVKASINNEYKLDDEIIYNICVSIENIRNLSGNIFECLCLIYYGMQGKKSIKDNTSNPEYDLIIDNELIQCKWHKEEDVMLNFHSCNKNYTKYKQPFSIISGSIKNISKFNNVNKNYIQAIANIAKSGTSLDNIKKYGIETLPAKYKESKKDLINILNLYITEKVDLNKIFNIEVENDNFFIKEEYINSISDFKENIDLKASVVKFVEYFDKKSNDVSVIIKAQEEKIRNNPKTNSKGKKVIDSAKMNRNIKAASNFNKGKTQQTIINTTKSMFNY